MSHNIGVDILHLPRLISLLSRRSVSGFTRRILTPLELAEFGKLSASNATSTSGPPMSSSALLSDPRTRFLATRWAAKEAAYKASTDIISTTREQWMGWKNFEISRGPRGEPVLAIKNGQGVKIGNGSISISHDGDYVIAMAMVPRSFDLKPV
ncbi:hypothetical protein H072_2767 [Dactylellina haptotyla CBS 200.50]|uniref:4'-phosphopantetheinyl transferase domain-containing protein n=1 Tax=Dactylellina haptotyla (strain CBS 200.50) TaxID=1284197 RepID=S8AJV6_DACHA|nr:hypothetical protein H072_2767 [Dactylellina haptotyla CBS 200.50]